MCLHTMNYQLAIKQNAIIKYVTLKLFYLTKLKLKCLHLLQHSPHLISPIIN